MMTEEGSSAEIVRISAMTSGYQDTRVIQDLLTKYLGSHTPNQALDQWHREHPKRDY